MSPESAGDLRHQCLIAADILERYVSVGYVPDIADCLAGIRRVISIDEIAWRTSLMTGKTKPIEQFIQSTPAERQRRSLNGTEARQAQWSTASDESVGSMVGSRPERVKLILTMGPDFLLVPLVRLYDLVEQNLDERTKTAKPNGLFDDNRYTYAGSTSRIAYRWYVKGDTELEARFMPRGMEFRANTALNVISSMEMWGEPMRKRTGLTEGDSWLHFEGVVGASDVRLTGGAKGIVEAEIRSESYEAGRDLLLSIIESVGGAAGDAADGVDVIVERRLRQPR